MRGCEVQRSVAYNTGDTQAPVNMLVDGGHLLPSPGPAQASPAQQLTMMMEIWRQMAWVQLRRGTRGKSWIVTGNYDMEL